MRPSKVVVYQIRDHHRHQEVQEVIPADYAGMMITDRGRSYDHHSYAGVKQQKCLAHLLRSIDAVLEDKQGWARWFGQRLKSLLKEGLALWHAYHEGKAEHYEAKVQALAEALSAHLRHRQLKDTDNQRLLNGMGWHHDRGNLLRFLYTPELQPTNNRTETALRPAVIARKVSQCSKNERGARTYAAVKSVTATMVKTGQSMIEGLYELFHFVRIPTGPLRDSVSGDSLIGSLLSKRIVWGCTVSFATSDRGSSAPLVYTSFALLRRKKGALLGDASWGELIDCVTCILPKERGGDSALINYK